MVVRSLIFVVNSAKKNFCVRFKERVKNNNNRCKHFSAEVRQTQQGAARTAPGIDVS
jgi:hypothetical protein